MRLPAKGSHVRRALEIVATRGGELDVWRCYSEGRGYLTHVSRWHFNAENNGECLSVGPNTWDALCRAGLVEMYLDPGRYGMPAGHIRLDADLIRRLLAAKGARP